MRGVTPRNLLLGQFRRKAISLGPGYPIAASLKSGLSEPTVRHADDAESGPPGTLAGGIELDKLYGLRMTVDPHKRVREIN